MKNLFNKLTAVASVCTIALCSTAIPVSADDAAEVNDITITFDYEAEGMEIKDEQRALLDPIIVSPQSSIIIPEAAPTRDGYFFSGWTYDGIHAYTYGDVFRSPDGNDVTLKAVWGKEKQEVKYTVKYELEQDGEIIDTSKELPDREVYAGQIVKVSLMAYDRDDAAQYGWDYDGVNFRGNEKFVMPEHDVTLVPHWNKRYKITYTVGDVDRVVGASFMEYIQPENTTTGLQANNRFSRNGFTISGWLCDNDNKIYAPHYPDYLMPDHDVTFTAVWEAKEYTVVFKQDKDAKNNLKVKGFTDTEITTPTATITQDGKYLAGWKDEDGNVYPAGSPYMIKGAIAGKGIVLDAVWKDGEPPETTTTQSTETTTTTTTTVTTATGSNTPPIIWGDSNNDGEISIADAVLIMQTMVNADEYKIEGDGKIAADVSNHGDGITTSDALVIQQVIANIISADQLPLYAE